MPKKRGREPNFFICPHCGAKVKQGALACRECGSDAETGWSQRADDWAGAEEYGYQDDDFDYEDFVEREFPDEASPSRPIGWKKLMISAVIFLLMLAFLMEIFLR